MSASNAAVREMPVPTKRLYEIEDDLLALLDSEDGVPAEMEEQFRADLAAALTAAKDKRERFAKKIIQDEADAKFARAEAKRITEWARVREARAERLRGYAVDVIAALPKNAKGERQKLEGLTVTMSARKCPESLEIIDASLVPLELKSATVTMAAEDWLELLRVCSDFEIEMGDVAAHYSVETSLLKAELGSSDPCNACEGSGSIPGPLESGPMECPACNGSGKVARKVSGARLITDKLSLLVK